MKPVKLALVVSSAIGLAALLVPLTGRSLLLELLEFDVTSAIVYAAIFALPLAMGVIGLARPPMQAWQSGVALAGCVLGLVRLRVWDIALHLPSHGLRGALLLLALVIGTVAAAATLLRPETYTRVTS